MMTPTCPPAELRKEGWGRPHHKGGAEDSPQCTGLRATEDDSDSDLTYGEVEHRLDLLQQHLNR